MIKTGLNISELERTIMTEHLHCPRRHGDSDFSALVRE
jgi:hypothetical protein